MQVSNEPVRAGNTNAAVNLTVSERVGHHQVIIWTERVTFPWTSPTRRCAPAAGW
jgi:hypothetical protein